MVKGKLDLPKLSLNGLIPAMEETEILSELKRAAARIAPEGCAVEAASLGVDPSFLSEPERARIAGFAGPRRQEFVAGRWCARQALGALGRSPCELLPDADGLPLWPAGVVGSITHCQGVAAAAVLPATDPETLLGLDLEKTNRLSLAASRRVLHPRETEFAVGDLERASVLFSLKEAFYKAQFPRWRTRGNFRDIALAVDFESGRGSIQYLADRFDRGLCGLRFRFSLVGEHVLSVCC